MIAIGLTLDLVLTSKMGAARINPDQMALPFGKLFSLDWFRLQGPWGRASNLLPVND